MIAIVKALRKYLDRIKPQFQPGGRLHAFESVFDGFETFLFTPTTTSRSGCNIHDSLDSKRVMIIVVLALIPCLLFGMYNIGYQHWLAIGATSFPFWQLFAYGFCQLFWKLVVAYAVGLGIEFPVEPPLWVLAVTTAFSVIFVKEIFGGTGYNIFNVALVTRAFLFFAYPSNMSGDEAFISLKSTCGLGEGAIADGFTGATPLGQVATFAGDKLTLTNSLGEPLSYWDMFLGLIPGSVGETSTLCILIGAAILLLTGIASWRIMLSVFAGGFLMGLLAHACETPLYPASMLTAVEQITLGGFAFAAVFMATDPVTAARTNTGKYIYGFLVGVIAIIIRTYNNGYPEGAMLAVLLMNALAPLIDYCVVEGNIRRRMRRLNAKV